MPNAEPKNRIAELRKDRGWSMEELATRAGTTASQINKLEKGYVRLNFDWMQRLARALDCHTAALLPDAPRAPASKDEEELLARYRGLSEQDKQAVFRVADALAPKKAD